MGTRFSDARSGRAGRRGLASFVSFLLLFAFALGSGGSLIALASGGGNGSKGTRALSEETLPVEEAPAEEAPAEEAPAADSLVEEVGGDADVSAAPAKRSAPKQSQLKTASAGRTGGILSHGGLHGGDVSLDFVAAGPFTYDHATGLGGRPEFGYDNRTISKTAGVVESLEGGDFDCGDLVTFFVQVKIAADADGPGTVELDMSFGAETTGQPGLGFDSIVSYGINTPDDGNVGTVTDNVVTANPPNGAIETVGYDELKSTFTVTNLAPGETAIVRITVHLDCEPGETPTGNILNAIESARADGFRVSVGQETVPMRQVGGTAAAPAIDVTKDCVGTAAAGEPVEYEITVANTGNVELTDITVVDDIIGPLSGFPDTLAVGADVTVTVTYTPVPSDGDPVINTVEATGTYEVNETTDTVSDTDDCITDITHAPGIEVTKSCEGLVAFGADISYTITVTNTGDEALLGVTVNDTLLGDITGEFDFDFSEPFPVDEVATAIVTYSPGADEDPVINSVTATGLGADSEVQAVSEPATCTTDVSNPAIQIVKTVSEEIVPVGTTVTYTFVVTNTGDVTLFDITVDDDIMGHIGDIPELAPGDFATLTKDFVVGDEPVVNVGTAVGEDILGRVVRDDDDAFVSPIAGENPPNPPGTPPGTPFTGSDAGRLGLITLILLGIGMTVVAVTRKRRPEDVV